MNRDDLGRFFVLREISDDYEEPSHVHDNVATRAAICGLTVSATDVRRYLMDLVGSGFSKAYRLSGKEPFVVEIDGLPPTDHFYEYFFWITDKGRRALVSWDDQWPLDEEDRLIPGWTPPSE